MIIKSLKGVLVFILLMASCILLIGGSSIDQPSPSIKSPGNTKPHIAPVSKSLLTIQKVYIHPTTGKLHVVIRNKKKATA